MAGVLERPIVVGEDRQTRTERHHPVRCREIRFTAVFEFIGRQSTRVNLLPTKDALQQHVRRAHLQASVWYADSNPESLPPDEFG
jgi:hypothetical protein